jgi:hypothetical protein
MDTSICILFGSLISLVVSTLKLIPFVKSHPKWVAVFFSSIIPLIQQTYSLKTGHSIDQNTLSQLLTCIGSTFTSSVATHEVVTHTIKDNLL